MKVFSDKSNPETEVDGFFAYVTFGTEDWIDTVDGWFPADSWRPEAMPYLTAADAEAAGLAFVGEYGK